MGQPKALLPAGSGTFVDRILQTFERGGLSRAFVVVRPNDHRVLDHLRAHAPFATAVVNPDADTGGQLSSLLAGIDAADERVEAVLVTLVDVPLVNAATIRALVERLGRSPALALRACYHGRHGHPVIFRRALFDRLRCADPAVGAKQVIRQFTDQTEDVDVEDPGVVQDIDTADDYARVFGRRP